MNLSKYSTCCHLSWSEQATVSIVKGPYGMSLLPEIDRIGLILSFLLGRTGVLISFHAGERAGVWFYRSSSISISICQKNIILQQPPFLIRDSLASPMPYPQNRSPYLYRAPSCLPANPEDTHQEWSSSSNRSTPDLHAF